MKTLSIEDAVLVRGAASDHLRFELKSDTPSDTLSALNLPPSLYLFVSRNKEYPPFYRHAWGSAFVSTNDQGSDRFPVERLAFTIRMPNPVGGFEQDHQERANAADVNADVKYSGAGTFGDFQSFWSASAYHPNYGSWGNTSDW